MYVIFRCSNRSFPNDEIEISFLFLSPIAMGRKRYRKILQSGERKIVLLFFLFPSPFFCNSMLHLNVFIMFLKKVDTIWNRPYWCNAAFLCQGYIDPNVLTINIENKYNTHIEKILIFNYLKKGFFQNWQLDFCYFNPMIFFKYYNYYYINIHKPVYMWKIKNTALVFY